MTILEFLTIVNKEIFDIFENYESKNNIPNEILDSMENITLMLHSFESGDISEETYKGLKQLVITIQELDPFGLWCFDGSSLIELSNALGDLYIQNCCEE